MNGYSDPPMIGSCGPESMSGSASPLPSIRSRTPEEVEQGYRMLDQFYAPYKRLVLPDEQRKA